MLILRPVAHRALAATVAACLAALVLTLGSTATASARDRWRIVNEHSGMILQPYSGPTAWRRPIVQRPKRRRNPRQLWYLNVDGYRISFENAYSHRCIHTCNWDADTGAGATLVQGSCRGTATASARNWLVESKGLWIVGDPRGIPFRAISEASLLYMDADGASTAASAPAVQAPYTATGSQIWRLVPVS